MDLNVEIHARPGGGYRGQLRCSDWRFGKELGELARVFHEFAR